MGDERNPYGFLFPIAGKQYNCISISTIVFHKVTVGSRVVSYWLIVVQVLKINQCCKATPKYLFFALPSTQLVKMHIGFRKIIIVEPRYKKGLRDRQNMFALLRFCYIGALFHTFYCYRGFNCYIFAEDVGATDESKSSESPNAAAIAVPVVLLLLITPAVVVAVLWYRRCVHYLFRVLRVLCYQWKRSHSCMVKSRIVSHLIAYAAQFDTSDL